MCVELRLGERGALVFLLDVPAEDQPAALAHHPVVPLHSLALLLYQLHVRGGALRVRLLIPLVRLVVHEQVGCDAQSVPPCRCELIVEGHAVLAVCPQRDLNTGQAAGKYKRPRFLLLTVDRTRPCASTIAR
eukprot:3430784-Prymnesium_polylepis.2